MLPQVVLPFWPSESTLFQMFHRTLIIFGGVLLLCCNCPVFSSTPEIAEELFLQAEKLVNTEDMPSDEVSARVRPACKQLWIRLMHMKDYHNRKKRSEHARQNPSTQVQSSELGSSALPISSLFFHVICTSLPYIHCVSQKS